MGRQVEEGIAEEGSKALEGGGSSSVAVSHAMHYVETVPGRGGVLDCSMMRPWGWTGLAEGRFAPCQTRRSCLYPLAPVEAHSCCACTRARVDSRLCTLDA